MYSANTSFDTLLEYVISTAKVAPQSGRVAKIVVSKQFVYVRILHLLFPIWSFYSICFVSSMQVPSGVYSDPFGVEQSLHDVISKLEPLSNV